MIASRNVIRKASQMLDEASQMLDEASHDQRNASAAFNFGEDFSRQSTQAIDNYDNFHLSPNDNELKTLTNRRLRMSNPSSHEPLWSVYRGDS